MVRNFFLWRRISGAIKRNFQPYIRRYISPNENFEYGYPNSDALFNIYSSNAQYFAPNVNYVSSIKPLRQPITRDVIYNVGASTVYRKTYWCEFLTLSNQVSRYIRKCIRMKFYSPQLDIKFADRFEHTSDFFPG